MSIRKRALMIMFVTIIGLHSALFVGSNMFLMDGFAKLEEFEARRNVERSLEPLAVELQNLDSIASNWAASDDAYSFVMDNNTHYIESNLVDGTFTSLNIDFMIFINSTGSIIFEKAFDLERARQTPVQQGLMTHVAEGSPLLDHNDTDSSVKGIILLQEGPVLVASRPILTSKGEGPIHGTLIIGRDLKSGIINRWAEITKLSLSLHLLNDSQVPTYFQTLDSSKDGSILIRPVSSDIIAGYALIRDIYGSPILALKVDMPRYIYNQGQISVSLFLIWIMIASLTVSVIVFLLLDRMILSRLAQLSDGVNRIGGDMDFEGRVSVTGRDELSRLAVSINGMLTVLEQSRNELKHYSEHLEKIVEARTQELLDAERMAAAGRIAAMVSHDLRGPLQTIRNASYLIGKAPERAAEMCATIEGAAGRCVSMIEETLNQIRDTPLRLEATDLASMIKTTIGEMSIPESVKVMLHLGEDLSSVSLDRIKMRRVLENLIRNALEAMPNGGTLDVKAESVGDEVLMKVSDTGLGIPEEMIDKLFKPFQTTKLTGTGLGLAYCKRTVEAHGGRMEVETEKGVGSSFTVRIPRSQAQGPR